MKTKKTLSHKQQRTAKKQFPKAQREEHQFGPKDYQALVDKRGA